MALRSIHIDDFRCIPHAHLELHPEVTLIYGANGSGKSSALEAIFLLGRGRSFRTSHLETAIRRGAGQLRVVGQVTSQSGQVVTIGIEAKPRRITARMGGEPVRSLASLSTAFPVQVIEPGVHKLIEEGPVRRRRFLDWGVFHVEPRYLEQWQRFHRAVRQRNAALRGHAGDIELDSWDLEMATAGEEVTRARQSYVAELKPYISTAVERLLGEPIEVLYSMGWPEDKPLNSALREGRPRDRQRKTSLLGPQRADLIVRRDGGGLAKDTVSRGQQKLLASALILGQLAYHAQLGMRPTLLMDDPAAELDLPHLERLIEQVRRLNAQIVITALQPDTAVFKSPGAVFHVEQGHVTRV